MTELETLLTAWNSGTLRGAKIRLSRELKVDDSTVSAWLGMRAKPSADKIKKMSTIFKKSEEEIKEIFRIEGKASSLREIKQENIPILGIVKDGEVIFFDLDKIPGKENKSMQKKFVLEIRDKNSEPQFKQADKLTIIATENTIGYEGNFCVTKKCDELFLKKLTKKINAEEKILGLVVGYYRQILDIK